MFNGGSPGLGYNVDKTKHIIINEEEAGIVTRIYQLRLSGYSCKNIADFLNEEGVRTKNLELISVILTAELENPVGFHLAGAVGVRSCRLILSVPCPLDDDVTNEALDELLYGRRESSPTPYAVILEKNHIDYPEI